MYALLAAALACVGASAGNLFFSGDRSLSVPFAEALNRCAVRFPVTGYLSAQVAERNQCWAAAYRTEGLFVSAATVTVPVLTAGLVFAVPWLDRWRLSRAGRWADIPGATARFRLLCEGAGLTGRRRPGMQVGGLTLRQAFTTALPGGRPLVVIPVKTALLHKDPQRFDPVLLHELAHVRARDVSWVSTVRGLALVTIPVLVLASVPEILDGENLLAPRTFLIQAAVFVVCSLLLGAAVLRRREIDADRQAVWWLDSPAALGEMLNRADALTSSARSLRWHSLLARHPSVRARIAALRDPLGVLDSGFAYALAAGAITAMVMNASYFIAWTFDNSLSGLLPVRVSAGAGALILGLGLTPALLRRAARARRAEVPASWWQPPAGTALGLFLGSLIPPGTALGATISFFIGQGLGRVAGAGILACLGAGIVTLTVGLVSLAAATLAHVPTWVTASLTAVMCCCAAVALLPVPGFNFSEAERIYLAFVLPDDRWRWLALLYPAAVIALATKDSARLGIARAVAASLATPILAATVTAVLFFPHEHAAANSYAVTINRPGEQQWWVAVFAGLVVLVVLALGRGIPGLARAWVSAWLTTWLVVGERAIYGSITSGWSYFGKLPFLLATPSVWLFYLAVPASCCALAGGHLTAVLKRQWIMPAATCAGAAAAALTILATGIPGLFVPAIPVAQVPLQGSDLSHPAQLTGTATPTGALTAAAARTIVTRVGEALPDNWTSDSAGLRSTPTGHLTITPATCGPFVNGKYLNALPRPLTQVQGQFKILPGFIDGAETLKVVIGSYARPVPADIFSAADQEIRPCQRYTLTGSSVGSITATVRRVAVRGLPVPAWRAQVFQSVRTASAVITWVELAVGHNLVILKQETDLTGLPAQPDEAVIDAAVRAVTPASAAAPPQASPPLKAGLILSQAEVEHIAGATRPYLGSSWVQGSLPAAAHVLVTYQPADCTALAHEDYLNTLPRPLARAEDQYKAAPALADDGLETLSVRVESFAHPVPASLLTAASRIFHACPRYTTQTSGSAVGSNGISFATTHAATEPGLGFPAWRGNVFIDLDPGSAAVTWIMITAGHNFILISQQTISNGTGSQPDEKVIAVTVAATIRALTHST